MNTKVICYPEVFFQRFLREDGVPVHRVISTLGNTSMRVTNEYFLNALKAELLQKKLITVADFIQAEFSYLDFRHTPYTDLLKQESILGKGGFTLTVAAGMKFVTTSFEPEVNVNGENYLTIAQVRADVDSMMFLPVGFRPSQILTSEPSHVQWVLIDFLARRFRDLALPPSTTVTE